MSDEKIHPIETMRDGAELVRVLERLAMAMELTEHRQSRIDDLLVGQWTNDVLFSGSVPVAPGSPYACDVRAPYAAVTIDDILGVGPLVVSNANDSSLVSPAMGIGRFVVPRGAKRTIAMTGTSLTVAAAPNSIGAWVPIQPPAFKADAGGGAGSGTVAAGIPGASIRVRRVNGTLLSGGVLQVSSTAATYFAINGAGSLAYGFDTDEMPLLGEGLALNWSASSGDWAWSVVWDAVLELPAAPVGLTIWTKFPGLR